MEIPRKKTIEEVKNAFQKRGYELLETKYENNKTKMKYRCPKHPNIIQAITFNNLIKGHGCRPCSYELRAEMNRKYSIDDVRKMFEKRGFKLLEKEYKNGTSKMRYICPKHPDKLNRITFDDFKRGNGCPHCYNERRGEKTKWKNNPMWNGGKTSLGNYIRKNIMDWYVQSMDEFERKCFVTGDTKNLEIHHPKPLSDIIYESLKELGLPFHYRVGGYTEKELESILNSVREKHKQMVGIPLRKDVHKKFHKIYGIHNNTFEQLKEFKSRIQYY